MPAYEHFLQYIADTLVFPKEMPKNWALPILTTLITIYMCNWAFYHVVLQVIWSSENPPVILHYLILCMEVLYDPFGALSVMNNDSVALSLEPCSKCIDVFVTFTLWALPDSIVKVRPDPYNSDPFVVDDEDGIEDLFVVLHLVYCVFCVSSRLMTH